MDTIIFKVSGDDVLCEYTCENIDSFRQLLHTLFSGELTESTLGYIINSLNDANRVDEALKVNELLRLYNNDRPVVEASEFK